MEGIVLSFKQEPNWCGTNVWLVKFRVKVRGQLTEREMYATGISQAHNDGKINMEAALAVASAYGGRRIRILSTRFVGSAVRAGHDWELQKEHWNRLKGKS